MTFTQKWRVGNFKIRNGVFNITDLIYKNCYFVQSFEARIFPWVQWTWNLVLGDFWGRWLRIRAQNSEIQNGGSNMVVKNAKSYSIGMTFGTRELFGVADYESKINI